MTGHAWDRVPIDAQSIEAPLSQAAIFLVVGVNEGADALAKVRDLLGGIDDLVKSVGFRDLSARLSCIVGIGSELWDRMGAPTKPRELKPFAAVEGTRHKAPATPGDLLFHIRAERPDFCFEFERILLRTLGSAVTMIDEVSGFRYFDARDLLGFVDGTANPVGHEIGQSALVGDEDSDFVGGSYVVVQNICTILRLGAKPRPTCRRKSSAEPRSTISNSMTTMPRASRTRRWLPSSMRMATSTISCATTCLSVAPATASLAPTSSDTPGICG